MDHPSATTVNFDTLVEDGYLENATDPGTKNTDCEGTVEIKKETGKASKLGKNSYKVYICCSDYQYEVGAGKPTPTAVCMANFSQEKYIIFMLLSR